MGQALHGSARPTEAVRRAIQMWRKRPTSADARMGPKQVRSTVLTPDEEAIIVAFRRHTLLPLGDCLYSPQPRPVGKGAPPVQARPVTPHSGNVHLACLFASGAVAAILGEAPPHAAEPGTTTLNGARRAAPSSRRSTGSNPQ